MKPAKPNLFAVAVPLLSSLPVINSQAAPSVLKQNKSHENPQDFHTGWHLPEPPDCDPVPIRGKTGIDRTHHHKPREPRSVSGALFSLCFLRGLLSRWYSTQSARGLAHSKPRRTFAATCLLTIALCLPVHAQYSIDWFTIDGGGGTSTGGVYAVSGTIGQPDAGPAMSGGNFTLTGGFWSLVTAVQTPGAPLLSILHTNGSVKVAWPWPSTGWLLQHNTALNTTNWAAAPEAPAQDGTNKWISITPPVGHRFYRLFKP